MVGLPVCVNQHVGEPADWRRLACVWSVGLRSTCHTHQSHRVSSLVQPAGTRTGVECMCMSCVSVCVVNERCVWRLLWRCGVAGLQRHPDADLGRLGEGRPAPKRLRAAGDLLDVPSGTASDGVVTNALRARPTLMADGQDSTNVGRRVCGCVCARGRQSNHFSHAWRASEFRASYEPVECSCLRL